MADCPWWAVPDWWAAIGTITAVVVAIFQNSFWAWWRRPKLKISIRVAPPDCVKTAFTNQQTGEHVADCYCFRLRVQNIGQRTAENVEVYAERLQRHGDDGRFSDVTSFPPMDLLWAHVKRPTQSISSGIPRHCDLGFIAHPQSWDEALDVAFGNVAKFCFDLEVKPNQGGHEIGAGTYRLAVVLGASNAKAQKKVIEITFEGQWYADETEMFSQGIGIKVID